MKSNSDKNIIVVLLVIGCAGPSCNSAFGQLTPPVTISGNESSPLLTVTQTGLSYAIDASASANGGTVAIYGSATGSGSAGVEGISSNALGYGIVASNSGGGIAFFAEGPSLISGSSANAMLSVVQGAAGSDAVVGEGNGVNNIGVYGLASASGGIGLQGYSFNAAGYGLVAGNTQGGPAAVFPSGNVGIGLTNPVRLLQVAGTIGAEEVIVSSTGADYVFESDYRLTPLGEVSDFIKANHHLPEIPSAIEVQERGVSLGEMQAKLLAKIEELTLHMIEANERIDDLERRNRALEGKNARRKQ